MEAVALMFAKVLGPMYLVLGLSVLLYQKVWAKIIKDWQSNHTSLIGLMLFVGVFGLLIVLSYNVWNLNVWLLVTLSGWAMVLKALAYFLLPGKLIKYCMKMGETTWVQYVDGAIGVILGVILSYYSYMA